MILPSPNPQPIPPLADVISRLPALGYTIDPVAWADPAKLTGWTQVTYTGWTAPCHPVAPPAQRP